PDPEGLPAAHPARAFAHVGGIQASRPRRAGARSEPVRIVPGGRGMSGRIISVVAALIRDDAGRVLLVRKRGTSAFMQPGGKRDAGESDIAALARELVEELGCRVNEDSARALGVFNCDAAN